jgi:hypothetical protein
MAHPSDVFISKRNIRKGEPMLTKWFFPDYWQAIVLTLSSVLHQRSAWRLATILASMLFARGRRTITSWLRAAGINRCYKAYYYFIGSLAQKTEKIATELFEIMIHRIYKNTNTVLAAIDDSPTPRYGPKVAGAGIHRNPTPTPDGRRFIYGHVWVTLSAIARHKNFGTIGLPLLARMYVKAKDIKNVGLFFQSKTEQAVELSEWAYNCCKNLGKRLWIVTDGGFTRASFLKPVIKMGAVIITRLRKDAVLYAELKQPAKGKRGRPRKYGRRIKLEDVVTCGRAKNPDGWFKVKAFLYGKEEIKEVKVFKALYKPAGCLVQVLVVYESKDCFRAFMCTDLAASAVQILEAVADRYAIEQNFSDIKEIEGAGQQQVRTISSNIGTFHLNLWLHSLVELWAWAKSAKVLCNRSDSPWDDANRRPSHADKCAALRREVLKQTFFVSSDKSHEIKKIHKQFYKLLKLVA